MNLDLPRVAAVPDNPWVEVDRIVTDIQSFALESSDDTTQIRSKLESNLKSYERREPFDPQRNLPDMLNKHPAGNVRYNTFGLKTGTGVADTNSNSPATFLLWQPHLDRDFASVMELMSVPLYGPDQVTTAMVELTGTTAPNGLKERKLIGSQTAGVKKFLQPQDSLNIGLSVPYPPPALGAPPPADLDNRWYRLLSFVEVPSRMHQHAGISEKLRYRIPGKINWNTMRTPDVLAALIDDQNVATLNLDDPAQHLVDAAGETARDWWVQFIHSRDRQDPITGMYLPGMPHARPFRDFGFGGRNEYIRRLEPERYTGPR